MRLLEDQPFRCRHIRYRIFRCRRQAVWYNGLCPWHAGTNRYYRR